MWVFQTFGLEINDNSKLSWELVVHCSFSLHNDEQTAELKIQMLEKD